MAIGLYDRIHLKRKSGRKMKKAGDKGAPTAEDFKKAKRTAKKKPKKSKRTT